MFIAYEVSVQLVTSLRDLLPAVERAVAYVRAGLAAAPALGGGARPLDHRVPTH